MWLPPLLMAAPLGVAGLALAWLADGEPIDSRAPRLLAGTLTAPEALGRSFRMVLAERQPDAQPQPLVDVVAPCMSVRPVAQFGQGTLDVSLLDATGQPVALVACDELRLEPAEPAAGEPLVVFAYPDESGRVVVPRLRPGRYRATLSSEIAGSLTRNDLVVRDGQTSLVAFRSAASLQERIAVRFVRTSVIDECPEPESLRLYGRDKRTFRVPSTSESIKLNVFHFDNLAPGVYDLAVSGRDGGTFWVRGLSPGSLQATHVQMPALPASKEPGGAN